MTIYETIEKVVSLNFEVLFSSKDIKDTPYVVYEKNVEQYKSFFDMATVYHNYRSETEDDSDPERLIKVIQNAKKAKKPTVFKINKFQNKSFGLIYGVYVGLNSNLGIDTYFEIWYFREVEPNTWKIFSTYTKNSIEGRWEYTNGEKLGKPGKLLETEKFVAPDDPTDLEDWENS
jgi:hypothetical protein